MVTNIFISLITVALVVMASASYKERQLDRNEIASLNEKLENLLNKNSEQIKIIDENTINREHQLQDGLEERIGDLERDLNDIKLILGKKSK